MDVQIVKWGNGQGIRLPKNMLNQLGLYVGDFLDLHIEDQSIVLQKQFRHQSLEERSEKFGGSLGPYEAFEWGDPQGKEMW